MVVPSSRRSWSAFRYRSSAPAWPATRASTRVAPESNIPLALFRLLDASSLRRQLNCQGVLFDLRVQAVNLGLGLDGLGERRGDAAVVLDVFEAEDSSLAVPQPFVQHLIATDLVFPGFLSDPYQSTGLR